MEALGRGFVPLSQRASEGVARILRTEILAGRLMPGEPLPERVVADQLGVSRTPVREALFTLQSEGLVELTPNRGATVRKLSTRDLEQIYALRTVVEALAARQAAQSLDERNLHALEAAYARLERMGGAPPDEQALADLSFHMLVAEATGSQLLYTIMGQVMAFAVSYPLNHAYPAERTAQVNEEHRAIVDALRNRNPDRAEKSMREHSESAARFALARFHETRPADQRSSADERESADPAAS